MPVNIGIVGLPNVGKSTLFNALSAAGAESANFPFCTIEPNVGVVPVPDERLDAMAKIHKSEKILPTSLEFVDIAGLVAGASKGEGLGNQFLAHIREVDAIAHVVRCFEDDNIVHVAGKIRPLDDIAVVDTELALKDLDTVDKRINRTSKQTKTPGKPGEAARAEMALLERLQKHLGDGEAVRTLPMNDDEKIVLQEFQLLTSKPVMFICNVAEGDLATLPTNANVQAVTKHAATMNAPCIPICAGIEAEVAELPPAERADFLAAVGLETPGLHQIIRAAYKLLGLLTFITAGPKETRAWTIRAGSKAPQAAGVIHTDFERGFIKAEVMNWQDLVQYNGEAGVKQAGKLRVEGKDYVMQDGDVVHFRFNV